MDNSGRSLLALMGLVLLAGCGSAQGTPVTTTDVLFLQSAGGVTVVETGENSPTFDGADAVPSGNWSTVVRGDISGNSTRVVATDPSSGTDLWADVIEGRLSPQVISGDGTLVALSPKNERFYTYGRRHTKLVIAGSSLPEARTIILDGNFEPEAFSTDGEDLFVVSYQPARAPSRYQVRILDLATGRVHGVYTPHDELQTSMGGTARIQAAGPDGDRLYTLYTVGGGMQPMHAFIHVLDLDQEWAHCIDMPDGFVTQSESATALTVSPDGKRLFAINSSTGAIAEIDTEALTVTRTSRSSFENGNAFAVSGPDSTVYVSSGRYVEAFDGSSLDALWSVKMDEITRGLQVTTNGDKLYVGLRREVAALDVNSGKLLEVLDPPGIDKIKEFGPVLDFEEEEIYKCAC